MTKLKCGIFISDEGYGHMVRQRAIINEFLKKCPNIEIVVFNDKQLFHLKESFGNKIKYVSIFKHISSLFSIANFCINLVFSVINS